MNREFVLRDNEVAINRPDGTVIIMNLNAFRELKGDSNKDKEIETLRQELAEAKHAAEAWKERHKLMSDERNRLAVEVRDLNDLHIDRMGEANKNVNDLKAKVEELNKTLATVRKQRDEALSDKFAAIGETEKKWRPRVAYLEQELSKSERENDFLTKEACKKNAEIQKLQEKLNQYSKQHIVLFGPTESPLPSTPSLMPDHVYIAHTGEVFFSQRDVEKAYNLAKGSVSAYFNDKQTALYARDPYGNRITDKGTGKEVTIGVVRRYANQIFRNRDINRPVWENYELAVKCAKDFVK